jgi:two-component system, OmpR family, phosphate regulon sensor histidine kinase PhoR
VKNKSPISVVLIGSIGVLLSLGVLLGLFGILNHITLLETIILFVLVFTVCFFVFYLIFRSFILSRMNVLYRSIRTGKLSGEKPFEMSMTKDILKEASEESIHLEQIRTKELNSLREKDEFRKEFIGNLSHELKTPVFSIQGYIETLLNGGLEDEKINRLFLERANSVVDRMSVLLSDLDVLSRLESQALELTVRPFDIRSIENLELIAKQKNIELRFSKSSDKELFVLGDKNRISQVLLNLLNNSIAYGNDGGVTEIRFFEIDNIISVEISDNGLGIDSSHLPRLFERFYRVEKSRNRNEGGTGLGLAIVKHIMEAHQQTVSVRSTVGKGSTFTFSLEKYKGSSKPIISSRGVIIKT